MSAPATVARMVRTRRSAEVEFSYQGIRVDLKGFDQKEKCFFTTKIENDVGGICLEMEFKSKEAEDVQTIVGTARKRNGVRPNSALFRRV